MPLSSTMYVRCFVGICTDRARPNLAHLVLPVPIRTAGRVVVLQTGKGKQRFFQENILPRMNELRGREDLNFIESLPAPNYKEGGEVDTGDPIVSEEVEMNPDWDAWEFRCAAHAPDELAYDVGLRRAQMQRRSWPIFVSAWLHCCEGTLWLLI